AGERQANTELLSSVYELALDHGDMLGIKIDVLSGDPKSGYTLEAAANNRNLKVGNNTVRVGDSIGRLPTGLDKIVFNDGDTHYVMTLPQNSQLLRGLTLLNSIERAKYAVERVA